MPRPKTINQPSPWNMRIRDEVNHEWLCQSSSDTLPYYGFDIRGGEVTSFQGIDWIYKRIDRWDKLIWERSTGLRDKNGAEIYEGDIVKIQSYVEGDTAEKFYDETHKVGICLAGVYFESLHDGYRRYYKDYRPDPEDLEVIGNIHENLELLEEEK